MKRGFIILMLILLTSFVYADIILYQDDFEDGILNQSIWENTTLVVEENGYVLLNGTTDPYTRMWLRNPINHSNRTIIGYYNFSTVTDAGANYLASLQKFPQHIAGFPSQWVGVDLGGGTFGRFNDFTPNPITNAQTDDNNITQVWLILNGTHICGKSISPIQTVPNPVCSSAVSTNKSYFATVQMQDVIANHGIYVYDFIVCEDTDNDFNCTIPPPPPQTILPEWDLLTPLNNSNVDNSTSQVFIFNLTIQNLDNASCDFVEDDVVLETETFNDGLNNFTATYPEELEETRLYFVNCSNGLINNATSTKSINIINRVDKVTNPQAMSFMAVAGGIIIVLGFVLLFFFPDFSFLFVGIGLVIIGVGLAFSSPLGLVPIAMGLGLVAQQIIKIHNQD